MPESAGCDSADIADDTDCCEMIEYRLTSLVDGWMEEGRVTSLAEKDERVVYISR